MTHIFTASQEMFFVILTLVLFAALIGDFRHARIFRTIGRMPDTRKALDRATKLFMILLVVFMAWAQDKDSQRSTGATGSQAQPLSPWKAATPV